MALDPRVRDELERRGPTNVRELLRIRTGPGDHDSVALQLAGVPDPPRSEVEDWLREAEREGETVTRDTLKWAKIAGRDCSGPGQSYARGAGHSRIWPCSYSRCGPVCVRLGLDSARDMFDKGVQVSRPLV
jgi:hypothetical protein